MSSRIFSDQPQLAASLYPFTLMRKVIDMPLGMLTIREKWDSIFLQIGGDQNNPAVTISSSLLPSVHLAKRIASLKKGQSLFSADRTWLATKGAIDDIPKRSSAADSILAEGIDVIRYPWDLLNCLESVMELDFNILTKNRRSQSIPKGVVRLGKHAIFISKGARIFPCTLNASAGPIYVGEHAEIQEGAHIRGPFLLGKNSVVKMGAKVYGPTAVGESCLLGGEVKRSLLFPFSNKAHDGYMGDSVIGSWCNWGAGTSNSNLKNTAGTIRIERDGVGLVEVGQKCGVFMGDHSRTAINATLNSGSVFGVSVQIGNSGLTNKSTKSFRWMDGSRYRLKDALDHIRNWKALKGQVLTAEEIEQFKRIYKTDK